jgi:cyclopropane fatty-acyl-phospholipid synthase-like methyltransferase
MESLAIIGTGWGALAMHAAKNYGARVTSVTVYEWATKRIQQEGLSHRITVRLEDYRHIFLRKWNYYLDYCKAGFRMRHISVVQAVYTRPNNAGLNPAP